ncbi:ATP-binding protein [Usitatibacter palustris]|uniref:Histidine kinase domain-containing protein n=1 Tax=Usitatibacter palustris TaxID=2732487 RepID=A0A6M4H8J1_9PROT|nr:ATP-binding protein [Usitatibacter palustris]QJR15926.1 hypothetical protein DSM104440_02753 [Usitatibacter palustris]
MAQADLHLSIDSHVVIQLGAELISDSEQALLELVKNSYDADATRCTISIEPEWLPATKHAWAHHFHGANHVGRIVVEDNGVGIAEDAVTRGWLFISASLKRSTDGSKQKTARLRTPVGDKGLGRLATMRLGDVLLMRTMTRKDSRVRTVSFSWADFRLGKPLSEIAVHSGVEEKFQGKPSGTSVEILKLHEPGYWESSMNVDSVIAKLSTLITPFRRLQDFHVNVRFNDQARDLQALGTEALNHAAAKFEFVYNEGVLSFKAWFARTLFRGKSGDQQERIYDALLSDDALPDAVEFFSKRKRIRNFKNLLTEPGGWLFSVEDSILASEIPPNPKAAAHADPGPFKGEIHYFLFNEPTKQSLRAANIPIEMLQGMTSIGMYRDGFRVRMDDDWLEISKGVTSGGFFQLRPKNVIGYLEISNEHNPALVEKSDREGFVDNAEWRGFLLLAIRAKKFANDALEGVRSSYDEYKKDKLGAKSESSESDASDDDPERAAKAARSALGSIKVASTRSATVSTRLSAVREGLRDTARASGSKVLVQIEQQLGGVEESVGALSMALEEARLLATSSASQLERIVLLNDQLADRNLRLIDAAAVGLSARGLTHEINAFLALIEKGVAAVRRVNKARPSVALDGAIEKITGSVRELKKTVASINPLLTGSRSLKDNFYAGDGIREYLEVRAPKIEAARVSVTLTGGNGPHVRFAKTRFNQVLENLLQNSLYWIEQHSTESKGIQRTVHVECDRSGFTWWDGGKGIRESVEESLFEPYVTEKNESEGQGLGLFLVTAFLQSERCHISLLPDRNVHGRRYKFRVDLRGAIK